MTSDLQDHLQTGATTVTRVWKIQRRDGASFGFTDHDQDLHFDGTTFAAQNGMSAKTIAHKSGLAVDNTEARGIFSDEQITEADINAGLFDDADVFNWLVNWQSLDQRKLIFSGKIGEIRRNGHAFEVELRGLSDALNQTNSRVLQKNCTAVLGDAGCTVNTALPAFSITAPVAVVQGQKEFWFDLGRDFATGWFEHGRLEIVTGAGKSLQGWIKGDATIANQRRITLWEKLRADIQTGDQVLLVAGCDKQSKSCHAKFNNITNFQGFPHIPGDDWMAISPHNSADNTGGAL